MLDSIGSCKFKISTLTSRGPYGGVRSACTAKLYIQVMTMVSITSMVVVGLILKPYMEPKDHNVDLVSITELLGYHDFFALQKSVFNHIESTFKKDEFSSLKFIFKSANSIRLNPL